MLSRVQYKLARLTCVTVRVMTTLSDLCSPEAACLGAAGASTAGSSSPESEALEGSA